MAGDRHTPLGRAEPAERPDDPVPPAWMLDRIGLKLVFLGIYMRKALITGITGQDGSYLAEFLAG